MLFVDGENLTIQGEKLAESKGIKLIDGPNYWPNVFLWMPNIRPVNNMYERAYLKLQPIGIRAYYYASMTGSAEQIKQASIRLRDLDFHPELFWKEKGKRSKGVDLTLAKDLLSHAFFGNFDVAVLLAGDGDYVPLVKEVKRLGKVVYSVFFNSSMSPDLRLASDFTLYMDDFFLESWAPPGQMSSQQGLAST
jgi:uncharacterized LabA/DUF88 family protein